MNTLQIDLMPFCELAGSTRPELEAPFTFAGHTYATDGHTAVVVPSGAPDDASEWQRTNVASMIDATIAEARGPEEEYLELPVPVDPWEIECPECHGKPPEKPKVCPDCHGTGWVTVDYYSSSGDWYDLEVECPACEDGADGICKRCENRGIIERVTWCQIGAVAYANRELVRARLLPGARLRPREHLAAHLAFDGGEGLLMPLRSGYDDGLGSPDLRDSSQRNP